MGAHAQVLRIAGFAVTLAALPAVALGHGWIGLGLLLAGRALAVLGGPSLALDLITLAGLPFAFALADPARAVAASFLMFGFVAVAASRRLDRIEEAVCTAGLALACLVPSWFSLIAYGLGVACFAVAGLRLARDA